MAAATTATATEAAAVTATKPQLSALKTCASSTYPSELRSPFPDTPKSVVKCEEVVEALDSKTPLTPPVAYVDFLKALSPALSSPATTPSGRHFSFTGVGKDEKMADGLPLFSAGLPTSKSLGSGPSAPTSIPSSSTSSSFSVPSDASGAASGSYCRPSLPPSTSSSSSVSTTSSSHKGTVPSPYVRPRSATVKPPWRLHVPQSPYSPARSPLSARSTVMSSSSLSSPQDWYSIDGRRIGGIPVSAGGAVSTTGRTSSSMSVRRVVTRKVTYARTPIDPAPKGKRRKVEDEN